ncbi:hypothetical protein GCM10009745_36150 [Kribbella yunnanensis]|uniref:Class I SAM-dependent methyltransferase n=1 Tax=Kribbella yunnanensis TaxID=190194 RepID=A0ABP4TI83_9ACTN
MSEVLVVRGEMQPWTDHTTRQPVLAALLTDVIPANRRTLILGPHSPLLIESVLAHSADVTILVRSVSDAEQLTETFGPCLHVVAGALDGLRTATPTLFEDTAPFEVVIAADGLDRVLGYDSDHLTWTERLAALQTLTAPDPVVVLGLQNEFSLQNLLDRRPPHLRHGNDEWIPLHDDPTRPVSVPQFQAALPWPAQLYADFSSHTLIAAEAATTARPGHLPTRLAVEALESVDTPLLTSPTEPLESAARAGLLSAVPTTWLAICNTTTPHALYTQSGPTTLKAIPTTAPHASTTASAGVTAHASATAFPGAAPHASATAIPTTAPHASTTASAGVTAHASDPSPSGPCATAFADASALAPTGWHLTLTPTTGAGLVDAPSFTTSADRGVGSLTPLPPEAVGLARPAENSELLFDPTVVPTEIPGGETVETVLFRLAAAEDVPGFRKVAAALGEWAKSSRVLLRWDDIIVDGDTFAYGISGWVAPERVDKNDLLATAWLRFHKRLVDTHRRHPWPPWMIGDDLVATWLSMSGVIPADPTPATAPHVESAVAEQLAWGKQLSAALAAVLDPREQTHPDLRTTLADADRARQELTELQGHVFGLERTLGFRNKALKTRENRIRELRTQVQKATADRNKLHRSRSYALARAVARAAQIRNPRKLAGKAKRHLHKHLNKLRPPR